MTNVLGDCWCEILQARCAACHSTNRALNLTVLHQFVVTVSSAHYHKSCNWPCVNNQFWMLWCLQFTKLSLPLIRFHSLPVHITFAISLPSSLPDPLGRRHWSLSFTHKLSRVSKSLTAVFGMRHLTYGTNFLHLFAFLVSRPPQSTLLHCQAPTLLLNRWLACLIWSFILVLKTHLFSRSDETRQPPI